MQNIINVYISLLPVILAGVANSIFVRLSLFKCLAKPIDGGKNFIDNKRIFGDSKTYKGFLGYIVLTAIFTVIWGLVCASIPNLQLDNFFYQLHANTLLFNVLIGSLLGLAWALFELPNSFIKRRLSIKPSANAKGIKGLMFMILDQADSIFGVMLVLAMFYPISVGQYFLFVAIGAATHILSNFLLFVVRIRKRPI